MNHRMRVAAGAAVLSLTGAVVVFGALLEGYRQAWDPVALLGADKIDRALAFNLLAFVVPGLVAAWSAVALRSALPATARWSARIGASLVLIAALAFAAQGGLPLDPADLEATATRLHATAWTLWWIAFVSGAFLLGAGLRGSNGMRGLAWASTVAAVLLLAVTAARWPSLPAGLLPRLGLATWLAWLLACARAIDALRSVSRGAASAPAPTPPVRR